MSALDRRQVVFGAESGKKTSDGVNGGGNPFATAVIAASQSATNSAHDFLETIRLRTRGESFGEQTVVVEGAASAPWGADARRIALVLMYSNYASAGLTALPGVASDAARVSSALERANFTTKTLLDANHDDVQKGLQAFAEDSARADIALMYCSGHGLELDGVPYLLPLAFNLNNGVHGLQAAHPVRHLVKNLKARRTNLVLSGACRDNPLGWSGIDKKALP